MNVANDTTWLDKDLGLVRIDVENRLFVLAERGGGYTCLGFDVCAQWTRDYATTLERPDLMPRHIGTVDAYRAYRVALDELRKSGKRCELQLTPQLVGLERKRVEVIDKYGEKRRFYVGKSTGFVPVHLEIKRKDSRGGDPVTGAPFKSIKIVGER